MLATNNDSSLLTCLDDGNWNAEPITCSPVCGRLTAKAQALIIGGDSSTGISDVPWQTAIYKESKKATKLICGGSILTKKVIISAAHCFFNDADSTWINKTRIKIIVGKYFRNYTAEENLPIQHFEVQEIKPNPVFNGFSGFYRADIALIILKGFISFQPHILPICIDLNEIDDRVVKAGEMGLVAGWGYTEAGGQLSRILKSIEMPVIDLEKCRLESGNFLPFVTSDKYCSGFTNGSGVCKGLFEI